MPIIGSLPYNIQNGDDIDAIPVMANFNFIAAQVNSNAPQIANITPTAFTPILLFGGTAVGLTYTSQDGLYSRIGNVVWYWIDIQINALGASTGLATVDGLPIPASPSMPGIDGVVPTGATLATGVTFVDMMTHGVIPWTTSIAFYNVTSNASAAMMTNANFTGGSPISLSLSGQYFTD